MVPTNNQSQKQTIPLDQVNSKDEKGKDTPVFKIDVTIDNPDISTSTSSERTQTIGGVFRGIAAASRAKIPILRAASTKAVRSIGSNRPLAFASEGAVAGNVLMPRWMYYGAWGLSGVAIGADITSRTWDAPKDKQWETAAYWTAFHVPASLVVPAVIIHQIVHAAEHSMEHHKYAKRIPARARPFFPVGVALLSIIPIVPTVDHVAEMIMEPTLGKYLGLEFNHHHHHHHANDNHSDNEGQNENSPPTESNKGKEKED
uniref:Mitochondrial fission process protein 1 n=1 Tax=Pseudo-nitzschia australis TaxID=44445 RepID=A0A7S4AHR1_9STRA